MICDLCPRRCGALRTEERGLGRCRMPELPVLARAALHRWEEPPISGTRGSGTIFFSGCSLGCVFCQNEEISHRDFGKAVTLERLARICGELVDQGAHNLNFVNPTHYAHVVGRLLEEHPQPVPVVWKSPEDTTLSRHPAGFGGKDPDLSARPEISGQRRRRAVFRRLRLSSDSPGRYPGDGAPDRPLRL